MAPMHDFEDERTRRALTVLVRLWLAQRIEAAYREARTPVPPAPRTRLPCSHQWVDVTPLDSPVREQHCTICGHSLRQPFGMLTFDRQLSDAEVEALVERWKRNYAEPGAVIWSIER